MKIFKLALIAATIAIGGASAAQADRWDHGNHDRGYHRGYDHHRDWRDHRHAHHRYYYRHGHRYWR